MPSQDLFYFIIVALQKNFFESALLLISLCLQGGGWCNDINSCLERAQTRRGSTRYMYKFEIFSGILSDNASLNPGVLFFTFLLLFLLLGNVCLTSINLGYICLNI